MEESCKVWKVATAIFYLVLVMNNGKAEVTCDQVKNALEPCRNYLENGGTIPIDCCAAIQYLPGLQTNLLL